MGYNLESIRVSLRLSAHNSAQDGRDRAAAELLHRDIITLIHSKPEYKRIAIDTMRTV